MSEELKLPELTEEEIKNLADFFDLLIELDRKQKSELLNKNKGGENNLK